MALEWLVIDDTKNHRIERLPTEHGEWTLTTVHYRRTKNDLHREVRLAFRPALPEGKTYPDIREELNALTEGTEGWTEEMDRLHVYTSSREIGNFQSWFEAEIMVQMLHEGDDGLPDLETSLRENGFVQKHHFTYPGREVFVHNHETLTNLEFNISTEGVSYHYSGSRGGWYNIGRLTGDHKGQGNKDMTFYVPWPANVKDFRRIGFQHMMLVKGLREKRGGLFRAPIQGDEEFLKGINYGYAE